MERAELIEKVKEFAGLIKKDFPVKEVILFGAWLEGLAKEDDEIEVAVVFDRLGRDLLESREILLELGRTIDPRMEPVIIEREVKDPVGFYREVLENGEIVFQA